MSNNPKKPIGIRQNNPMNIRISSINWRGELGNILDQDERFEEFKSPEYGIRAGMKLLLTYYNRYSLDNVTCIINRWAPPIENDTCSYQRSVAKKLGVHVDDVINLDNKETMITIAKAIVTHENGTNQGEPWYDDETYEKAYALI